MEIPELTLRQLIQQEISKLALEVKSLTDRLEFMTNLLVSNPHELDVLKLQVASLSESLHDLELRVKTLEKHSGVATEVTRQAFTVFILMVLLLAWGVFS